MKKTSWLFFGLASVFILAACTSSSSENLDELHSPHSVDEVESADLNSENLSAADVIQQSLEVDEKITSFSAKVQMKEFAFDQRGDPIYDDSYSNREVEGRLSYQENPSMLSTNFVTTPLGSDTIQEEHVGYLTEDGFYSYTEEDGWTVSDPALTSASKHANPLGLTPDQQLSLLLSAKDYLTLGEEEDIYTISIEANSEDLKKIAKHLEMLGIKLFDIVGGNTDEYSVAQLDYMLFINKETFLLEGTNSAIEVDVNQEDDDPVTLRQELSLVMTDYNHETSIQLPEEAKETALQQEDQN
ncbi:DUF6612 family protein [Shouchella shacheensis]|uniref:DUF6612 family protein n=1 Tax=Shouchella shacheensis TaxID=1649580 RepID=UPI0007400FAE|nr:DUF6612 family protein [Shouchella shacheensis]